MNGVSMRSLILSLCAMELPAEASGAPNGLMLLGVGR